MAAERFQLLTFADAPPVSPNEIAFILLPVPGEILAQQPLSATKVSRLNSVPGGKHIGSVEIPSRFETFSPGLLSTGVCQRACVLRFPTLMVNVKGCDWRADSNGQKQHQRGRAQAGNDRLAPTPAPELLCPARRAREGR